MTRPTAYDAVQESVGWIDRSDRVRLAVTGPDRARLLHNLVTNDVLNLAPGAGCEAFVTSPQGKTLAWVFLHAAEDRILLRSDPGALEAILAHFSKYGLFDDAAWNDLGASTFELHLAGPRSDELLDEVVGELPTSPENAHFPAQVGDRSVLVIRETPTGRSGWTLIGSREDEPAVRDLLARAGSTLGWAELDRAAYDVLRIEAGTPEFGRDVTAANLPQEVGRDTRTIHLSKGCYLGQETVARIDALGHVNRLLKGLRISPGPVPASGTPVLVEGAAVGTVTSAAESPGWRAPLALAYVRTKFAEAGTRVTLDLAGTIVDTEVADLPMLPPKPGV